MPKSFLFATIAVISGTLLIGAEICSSQTDAQISNLQLKTAGTNQVQLQEKSASGPRSFWITEFGYNQRFHAPTKVHQVKYQDRGYQWIGTERYTPAKHYFTWEVGHMRTMSSRSALGAALFVGTDANDVLRFGVKPRYRRQLERKMYLDIAPGILIKGGDPLESAFPGVTMHVGLNFQDTVILYGQMEANRMEKYGTDVAWYAGVKLGSSPGLIVGAVFGLIEVIQSLDFGSNTGGATSLGGCGG